MNIEQLLKEYESASKYEMIKFLYEERNLNSTLNSDKDELYITIWKKDKEIERLNNIIDELELYLKNNIKASFFNISILDKLKELKEGK